MADGGDDATKLEWKFGDKGDRHSLALDLPLRLLRRQISLQVLLSLAILHLAVHAIHTVVFEYKNQAALFWRWTSLSYCHLLLVAAH
jgi:hypothetical protein